MRHVWLALLLLAPAHAATWDDPADDQQYRVESPEGKSDWQDGAADQGMFPYMDITRIALANETAEGWTFEITLSSLDAGNEPATHRRVYYGVAFEHDDRSRQLYFEHDRSTGELTFYHAVLFEYVAGDGSPREYWGRMASLPAEQDGLTFRGEVPKWLFRSADYIPVRPGDVLSDMSGFATGGGPFECPGSSDAACIDSQDLVGPAQDVEVLVGDPAIGDLVLFSEQPWRGSNGAATTYLFDVGVHNLATQDDVLTIQTQAPDGWTARSPATFTVPAESEAHFSVAVTVPFQHTHGTIRTMEVRATSSISDDSASTELGVIWHDPPQPGGHHPGISLHVNDRFTFLDTNAQESAASAEAYLKDKAHDGAYVNETWTWQYPLVPVLAMGLDFTSGPVTGRSSFVLPAEADVSATARLMLSSDPPTVLAQQTQTGHWPEGQTTVEWTMPLETSADRHPLEKGQNLYMEFDLQYERLEPSMGTIGFLVPVPSMALQDNRFHLPLRDYHDIIDADLASQAARLSLGAERPERLVNPGETVIIEYALANGASQTQTIDWDLSGTHAEWARLVDGDRHRLEAGQNATLRLVVEAPEDSTDGDEASLLLTGTERDTGVQVFGRALVTVTTTQDTVDQGALAEALEPPKSKGSPTLALPLLLGALLLARR